jgi:hypothetical protein
VGDVILTHSPPLPLGLTFFDSGCLHCTVMYVMFPACFVETIRTRESRRGKRTGRVKRELGEAVEPACLLCCRYEYVGQHEHKFVG